MKNLTVCQTAIAKKKNNKGFSLVELIIVITIMAVLTAILAPQFLKYVERSREARDRANLNAVFKVFEVACVDYGAGGNTGTLQINGGGSATYAATGRLGSMNPTLMARVTEAFGGEPIPSTNNDFYQMPPLVSQKFKNGVVFRFKNLDINGKVTTMTNGNNGGMVIITVDTPIN